MSRSFVFLAVEGPRNSRAARSTVPAPKSFFTRSIYITPTYEAILKGRENKYLYFKHLPVSLHNVYVIEVPYVVP